MKKMRHKNRICRILHDNKGTTMMETLVAFVVLMVILVGITKLVSFSSELRMRAMDTNRIMQNFNKDLYSTGTYKYIDKVHYETSDESMGEGKVKGPVFYLEAEDGSELWVSDIEADGYSYKSTDEVVQASNMALPKVLVFVHEKDK